MADSENLLHQWWVTKALNHHDAETLKQYQFDGKTLTLGQHNLIARLPMIHSSRIQAIPFSVPISAAQILTALLAIFLIMATIVLQPWILSRHGSEALLYMCIGIVVILSAWSLWMLLNYQQKKTEHRYFYELLLYPQAGPPITALSLTDLKLLQELQFWFAQFMPQTKHVVSDPTDDVIQEWLAQQHTELINYQMLSDLRLHQGTILKDQHEHLLLHYVESWNIQKSTPAIEEAYQTQKSVYSPIAIQWQVWGMVVGLYLPWHDLDEHFISNLGLLGFIISMCIMVPLVMKQTKTNPIRTKSSQLYALMASTPLGVLDQVVAVCYDQLLLEGLQQLLMQAQNNRRTPPENGSDSSPLLKTEEEHELDTTGHTPTRGHRYPQSA